MNAQTTQVPVELADSQTPPEVVIRAQARKPETDPTLGLALPRPEQQAAHRLVVLGDSLSHGFQSFAIFNTDLSYPALIARTLGWYSKFRHPEYRAFGGLPLNLEYLARELELKYGAGVAWWELASAAFTIHHLLNEIRVYWERGPGSHVPGGGGIMHNLAVSGFDLNDLMTCTADTEREAMQLPQHSLLHLLVQNVWQLMALYVLDSARDSAGRALTPVQAARAHGEDGGIETLIIFIGANNALRTVTTFEVKWSGEGFDDPRCKGSYTVWRPSHFRIELDRLQAQVRQIKAQHVIWCTVPHVTIAPIARGCGRTKMRPGSRYFPYYTRPWIDDAHFDPAINPHLTGDQARAIDSAIDMYNDDITAVVRQARQDRLDWLLLDIAGLLDRLAARRYILDADARPDWWTPYPLPRQIAALSPVPDSRYLHSGPQGRTQGGIFSLDGVHPTTITYGILAQEFLTVMQAAGVKFPGPGAPTLQSSRPAVNFDWLIQRDTLISDPLKSLTDDLEFVGWADELIDWVRAFAAHF